MMPLTARELKISNRVQLYKTSNGFEVQLTWVAILKTYKVILRTPNGTLPIDDEISRLTDARRAFNRCVALVDIAYKEVK